MHNRSLIIKFVNSKFMETKLLDLNAYGVSGMSNAEMREKNGGMTFQADVMRMMPPEAYDAAVGTLFVLSTRGVRKVLMGFFGA